MTKELTSEEYTNIRNQLAEGTPSILYWDLFMLARAKMIEYRLAQGMTIPQIHAELTLEVSQLQRIMWTMDHYKQGGQDFYKTGSGG